MAIEINNAVIRDACIRAGLGEPEPGVLHIFGIRGAVPYKEVPQGKYAVTIKENMVDEWNDTIGMFGTAFGIWRGTVDPGMYYTLDPLNTHGCAHLNNGCWLYSLGSHKGHEALVQAAPVTVTRDEDRDAQAEPGEFQETGYFGIDIHAGEGAHVGQWSAGCQVIFSDNGWNGPQWTDFLHTVKASGHSKWKYWLFDNDRLLDSNLEA